MDEETLNKSIKSGLLPVALVIVGVTALAILIDIDIRPQIVYHFLQYIAAFLKAGFIMRLKVPFLNYIPVSLQLFWTPYNAILASMLVSNEAFDLVSHIASFVRYLLPLLHAIAFLFMSHSLFSYLSFLVSVLPGNPDFQHSQG